MAQLERLTVPALAARLVHSRHHLLALRMCRMMGLPTDQARTKDAADSACDSQHDAS